MKERTIKHHGAAYRSNGNTELVVTWAMPMAALTDEGTDEGMDLGFGREWDRNSSRATDGSRERMNE